MSENLDKILADEKSRILRYRALFGSEDGKKVLQDLHDKFLWQDSRPHVAAGNQLALAFIDGQRSLMRALNRWLSADLDSYLDAYRKPIEVEQGDPLNGGESTYSGGYA